MKRLVFPVLFIFLALSQMSAQFGDLVNKAKKIVGGEDSELNIAGGLKEALNNGVDDAVKKLSAENGYFESPYKVLLPAEAREVVNKVEKIPGFNDVGDKLVKKMNEAAEIAAKEATPIFVDAIKSISFDDARKILFGEEDAATRYLEKSSRNKLYNKFLPVIQNALDEVNAREYWKSVVDQYNKIPFVTRVNPQLDDHVNNEALDGMFGLIEKKEEGIRSDIDQRTSPLLKDVFGQLDN